MVAPGILPHPQRQPRLRSANARLAQFTGAGREYDSAGEIDLFSMSLGDKKALDYDIASHSEAMSQLRKAIGVQSNSLHNSDISRQEYMNNKLIMGVSTKVFTQNALTGHSLKNGEAVTCRLNIKMVLLLVKYQLL